MKFTVRYKNAITGTSHFEGAFDVEADAVDHAISCAKRSRKFVEHEVWTGTPKNPGHAIIGHVYGGKL